MSVTSGPGVRGPYAKTARVRQRILDACAEVFAASGFRGTTMKEVAERAGISERGLAHHFSSKVDLLAALLDTREEENTKKVAGVPGLGALMGMLTILKADTAQPGVVELHSILSAEATSPEHPAHDRYRDRYDVVRDAAVLSFAALRRAGELKTPLSDEELGAIYVALMDGLQIQWLYNSAALDSAALIERFLGSVIPRLAEQQKLTSG